MKGRFEKWIDFKMFSIAAFDAEFIFNAQRLFALAVRLLH
jgi:hypothetical protein